MSGAYVYSGTTCTICGKDYESDDCMHIVGRPYNGEFCQKIVKEIVSVNHVAIVKNPASKRTALQRSRVLTPSREPPRPEHQIRLMPRPASFSPNPPKG